MDKKLNRIYEALVEGAAEGLADKNLYSFVASKCAYVSNKRIVKAALLALTDPDVRDRDMLERIYALAIDYRMSSLGVEDGDHDDDDEPTLAPVVSSKLKLRLETSVSSRSSVEDWKITSLEPTGDSIP